MSGPNEPYNHAGTRVIVTTYGNDCFYLGPPITLNRDGNACVRRRDGRMIWDGCLSQKFDNFPFNVLQEDAKFVRRNAPTQKLARAGHGRVQVQVSARSNRETRFACFLHVLGVTRHVNDLMSDAPAHPKHVNVGGSS